MPVMPDFWKSTELAGLCPEKVAAVTVTLHLNGTWKFGAATASGAWTADTATVTPTVARAAADTAPMIRRTVRMSCSSAVQGADCVTSDGADVTSVPRGGDSVQLSWRDGPLQTDAGHAWDNLPRRRGCDGFSEMRCGWRRWSSSSARVGSRWCMSTTCHCRRRRCG